MHHGVRRPVRVVGWGAIALALAAASWGIASDATGQEPLGVSVSGLAFVDANNSGARDAGEISIAGLALTLDTQAGRVSTTTDETGRYEFANVAPGWASISGTSIVGSRGGLARVAGDPRFDIDLEGSSTPLTIDELDISNFDAAFTALPAGTAAAPAVEDPLPLPAPMAIDGPAGSVTGVAFIDHNNNSVRDQTEIGVNGLPVSLHAGTDGYDNSTIVQTVLTSEDGQYEFAEVVPGRYTLSYLASSWGPSRSNIGANDAIDSDFGTSTTHSFVVDTQAIITLDAGFQDQPGLRGDAPAKVSGLAFLDANGNGLRDQGERALSGVPITFSLTDSAFEVAITTTAEGTYEVDLIPGRYKMVGSALLNGQLSVPLVGTDRRFDSNLTPSDVLIAPAQILSHFDVGFLELPAGAALAAPPADPAPPPAPEVDVAGSGSIGGRVSVESFGGRGGMTLVLLRYDDPNGPAREVEATVSNDEGRWQFVGVESGYYRVVLEPADTQPQAPRRESLVFKTDFYPSQTAIFVLNGGSGIELLALRDVTSIPPSVIGDANCDGIVTAGDARLVLRYVSGEFLLESCNQGVSALDTVRADADRDGQVTVLDALLISQRVSTTCPEGTFLWEDGLCYPIPGSTPGATVTPTLTTPVPPLENYGSVPCRPGYAALTNGRCWPLADNTNPTTVTPVPSVTPG